MIEIIGWMTVTFVGVVIVLAIIGSLLPDPPEPQTRLAKEEMIKKLQLELEEDPK